MKNALILAAIVSLLALPALGGEGHKCTAGTQECLNMMAKNLRNKGLIGVDGEWDESAAGYRIASFLEGSEAKDAGVRAGDLLVAINGIALNDGEASKADEGNRAPGSKATITVKRGGEMHDMKVRLVAMSDEQIAKYVGAHMLEHVEIASAN